jgi:transcription termination factor Rho
LKDVILPSISYETSTLQNLLSEMKGLTLHPGVKADAWNKTFEFFGTIVNVAEGGIHSVNEPEVIIPKEDEMLID